VDRITLVEQAKQEGRRLLEALDRRGFRITAALWLSMPDAPEWRLILATPLMDELGPKEVYTQILASLQSLQPPTTISLNDVWVTSPNDGFLGLLRQKVTTGPGISGMEFVRTTINGILMDGLYLYRLLPGEPQDARASRRN
jgi:hypothetical protein